jgi:hypothetical protein
MIMELTIPKGLKAWRHIKNEDRDYYRNQPNGLRTHVKASEFVEAELEFTPIAMLRKQIPKTLNQYLYLANAEVVLGCSPFNDQGEKVNYYTTFMRELSYRSATHEQRKKALVAIKADTGNWYSVSTESYELSKLPGPKWGRWLETGSSTLYSFYTKFYKRPLHNPNSKHDIIIPMPEELLDAVMIERLAKHLDK